MRIASIAGYAIRFPFVSGGFTTFYGTRTELANLLIAIETDDGFRGYGEVCQLVGASPPPLNADEIAHFASHCRDLLGLESRDVTRAVRQLGPDAPANLRCGVDTALWDMMGRRTGEPLHRLFGGPMVEHMPVYVTLSSETPELMVRSAEQARQHGVSCFQIKLEGRPELDLPRIHAIAGSLRPGELALADANGGFDVDGAVAVCAAVQGTNVMLEEPCRTFEENLDVARRTGHPVVLDQCMSSPVMYARAVREGVFAGTGIKPTNLGGLTPARAVRDLCIAAGLPMKIDDSWAADVGSLGALHLAAGVPSELLLATIDMRIYFDGAMFVGSPGDTGGTIELDESPGLGLTPQLKRFGDPVFSVTL